MNKFLKIFSSLVMVMLSAASYAQTTTPEQTDFMRSNGKIYVVVAVVLTILLGVFIYLFSLDRKISKLEKTPEGKNREMRL